MRRWYMPLAVLGFGSLGVVLLSERGRSALRSFFKSLDQAHDGFLEFNSGIQDELNRIQAALDRLADSADPHPELGR